MSRLLHIGGALAIAACIAGCASHAPPGPPAAVVTPLRTKVIPGARTGAIDIGKSTRSDLITALGETQVISFESGFEVWVYRIATDMPAKSASVQGSARGGEADPATGEFVVLIAPSGVVAKTRIRPSSNGDARLLDPAPAFGKP